ncbi:MAG: threonine/serine exporter family protein [Candidatus Scatovivens sp.]
MIIQMIAAFLAVFFFSVTLEVNKKFIIYAGITGMLGWITYLICKKFQINDILSYMISGVVITLVSYILSKIFKVLVTIFLIPGILPIVPGVAIYRTVYYLIMNNIESTRYYLIQTVLIAGSIAIAIFLAESIVIVNSKIKKNIVKSKFVHRRKNG